MKKLLFSAAVLLGAMGIFVSNSSKANNTLPATNHNYIVKDTTPTDTTTPEPTDTSLFKL